MEMNRFAPILGVLILGLAACGGGKDPTGGSESSSNSITVQSSSAQTSSSAHQPYSFVGEWVLTEIWKRNQVQDVVLEPYYLSIDVPNEIYFSADCGDVIFTWDGSSGIDSLGVDFDATAQSTPGGECNNDSEASAFISWISGANLIALTDSQALKISHPNYSLSFEKYPVLCREPVPWPSEQTFTPNVRVDFETSLLANQGLKDFVLNYDDFSIQSWGESCTVDGQERVNVQLNLKTLNVLRCERGVTAIEFIDVNGGEL